MAMWAALTSNTARSQGDALGKEGLLFPNPPAGSTQSQPCLDLEPWGSAHSQIWTQEGNAASLHRGGPQWGTFWFQAHLEAGLLASQSRVLPLTLAHIGASTGASFISTWVSHQGLVQLIQRYLEASWVARPHSPPTPHLPHPSSFRKQVFLGQLL